MKSTAALLSHRHVAVIFTVTLFKAKIILTKFRSTSRDLWVILTSTDFEFRHPWSVTVAITI